MIIDDDDQELKYENPVTIPLLQSRETLAETSKIDRI
jgi:hypothetical protein